MLEDMQVRNLTFRTQTAYVRQVSLFARHFGKSPEALGLHEIRAYRLYLINEKNAAPEDYRERYQRITGARFRNARSATMVACCSSKR
jgi:hypothetical protein